MRKRFNLTTENSVIKKGRAEEWNGDQGFFRLKKKRR